MKFTTPKNQNYCATVVEVKNIIPLENCDNVVATSFFGFQAIVNKETKVGDVGILFTTETRLSDEYCYNNNLYRHADRNKDQNEKGYIEDNGRVKAIKFRGNTSNCIFMPLSSIEYTKIDLSKLEVGDEFDMIGESEICRKYEVATKLSKGNNQDKKRTHSRVNPKHMPEHISSSNFFKYGDIFNEEDDVIVTQKLHGTSIRVGNVVVERKLNLLEKVLKKLGVNITSTEFDNIYGSRKVIKDVNNPFHNHFYNYDLWSEAGSKLNDILPENYIVYGELIGYTSDGAEIQKSYSYDISHRTNKLYVYRIAVVNGQGVSVDLSWLQLKEFCKLNGLNYVPEIWTGKLKDMKIEQYIDVRLADVFAGCLTLGDNKDLVDEGVCIRREGITPTILKAKSPKFFEHESSILDSGVVDLESSQSQTEE